MDNRTQERSEAQLRWDYAMKRYGCLIWLMVIVYGAAMLAIGLVVMRSVGSISDVVGELSSLSSLGALSWALVAIGAAAAAFGVFRLIRWFKKR